MSWPSSVCYSAAKLDVCTPHSGVAWTTEGNREIRRRRTGKTVVQVQLDAGQRKKKVCRAQCFVVHLSRSLYTLAWNHRHPAARLARLYVPGRSVRSTSVPCTRITVVKAKVSMPASENHQLVCCKAIMQLRSFCYSFTQTWIKFFAHHGGYYITESHGLILGQSGIRRQHPVVWKAEECNLYPWKGKRDATDRKLLYEL